MWLVLSFAVVCVLFGIFALIASEYKDKKAKERMKNLGIEDFHKMYSQYEAIVEGKVEEIGDYAREYVCEEWLTAFHEYLYHASAWLTKDYFTDFHIAAAMFFALTSDEPSKYDVLFVYDCVRNMISAPKTYIRHIRYGNELELQVVKDTFDEVDFSIIENRVSPDEICKIIQEVYLSNKNGAYLIRFADFLGSLYDQC